MSKAHLPRALCALVATLLLTLASCAGTPPPKPPVRELPQPAAALLSLAPTIYGDRTPIKLPDDAGSADAQAAFGQLAGPSASHEPALDLVAAVIGKTYAEEQEVPAQALLQWLFWKCGAATSPGPVNVFVAPPGATGAFAEHIRRLASFVPTAGEPLTYGVARIQVNGYIAQAIAIGRRHVDLVPLPKSQPPGAKVQIKLAVTRPYTDLSLYADQGGPEVTKLPMTQTPDGSFIADVTLPTAPGRYFIEVIGTQPPPKEGQKGWRTGLLWLPLYVATPEPAAADDFIRHPPKNHPDVSTWKLQIISAYNEARKTLGRAPLTAELPASQLAQSRSDEVAAAAELPPPDFGFNRKLADAGLPSRNVRGYVDEIEYVSEYITLRLLRPAARHTLFDPAMTTIAIGLTPRQKSLFPRWSSAEYVFEIIRIDPPREQARLQALMDTARGTPFNNNAPLTIAAQTTVESVCKGGPKPTDAKALFARAQGLSPTLNDRLAVPWIGYDFGPEDAAAVLQDTKDFTDIGIGVCQGTIDNAPGAVMVLMLFAKPREAPKP
ncbi:MAG: hypothetical protein R3B70_13205 [Polyangiaceae bacterium]